MREVGDFHKHTKQKSGRTCRRQEDGQGTANNVAHHSMGTAPKRCELGYTFADVYLGNGAEMSCSLK